MALLPAFAIDGGRVPASMLRMLAWVSTSGAAGIVTPEDFKVQALPTPGGAVSVNAGGVVIPTRYGNSTTQQSYAVANDQAFNVPVASAGAGGRTDYVILRISDPQYSGQVPADPQNALYCEVVTVSSLPTTYPYLALAKIVLPASTATITNSMITDMRVLAQPRRERHILVKRVNTGEEDNLTETGVEGESWPDVNHVDLRIPTWATSANIVATFAQVVSPSNAAFDGVVWAALGTSDPYRLRTQDVRVTIPAAVGESRETFVAAGSVTIPANMRGGSYRAHTRGKRLSGSSIAFRSGSAVTIDIEFIEGAI